MVYRRIRYHFIHLRLKRFPCCIFLMIFIRIECSFVRSFLRLERKNYSLLSVYWQRKYCEWGSQTEKDIKIHQKRHFYSVIISKEKSTTNVSNFRFWVFFSVLFHSFRIFIFGVCDYHYWKQCLAMPHMLYLPDWCFVSFLIFGVVK